MANTQYSERSEKATQNVSVSDTVKIPIPFDRLLPRLQNARMNGEVGRWKGSCPGGQQLSVRSLHGQCFVKCPAGCDAKAIVTCFENKNKKTTKANGVKSTSPKEKKPDVPVADNPTPAVEMILKSTADWELFQFDDVAHFTAKVSGHFETHLLGSRAAKSLLCREYYRASGRAPNPDALASAQLVLDGKARFDGRSIRVGTRIMADAGAVWLDLCNQSWQAVRITSLGWDVVDNPPVKFVRRRGMLPLPTPLSEGYIGELRPLLNAKEDDNWILLVAWIVGVFMPTPPFPVLGVSGEQGSAKSTLCRMIRRLIDPNAADLRSAPKDERDLMIAATNSRVVALDNVSMIPPSLSDALCRLATGSGFGCRELYSDSEEKIFAGANPIILNGIGEIVERPDLAERSLFVHLPPVAESARRTEAELWGEFERLHPRVLGAVLDAVVVALDGIKRGITVKDAPRMADFARWVVAAEAALPWKPTEFLAAYRNNRSDAEADALQASMIGKFIVDVVDGSGGPDGPHVWEGTSRELLDAIDAKADEKTRRRPGWPQTPRGISAALARIAPILRRTEGIERVDLPRDTGKKRDRKFRLHRLPDGSGTSSAPSAPSASSHPSASDSSDGLDDLDGLIPTLAREA